jgi:uncharacterized membrane protein
VNRRAYLDWLRGVAVLIMIEAHTLDSWTRLDDRGGRAWEWSVILGGFGAPIFLLLAGIALALAAGSRRRQGLSRSDVTVRALRRGLFIFGLAFLFRLQSWLISGGPFPESLLKVDILNIMGVSMLAAAALWGLGRDDRTRAVLLVSAALLVAMLTPLVRATPLLASLPDPMEWYVRPFPGRATFTLFPWGGFLLAGGAVGLWLDAARTPKDEQRVIVALAFLGPTLAGAGYAASFLPPLYAATSFWTSSPTFFFVRLGILIAAVPLAYAWNRQWRGWSPLQELGLASLFVYWIHVEMVYGILSTPLHRRLPFELAVVALAAFSALLFGVVKLKERHGRSPQDEHRAKLISAARRVLSGHKD